MRRNNDELLANWGNLVNRTLVERVPQLRRGARAGRAAPRPTRAVLDGVDGGVRRGRRADRAGALPRRDRRGDARSSTLANQYVAEQAPWALVKTDRERAGDRALRRAPLRRLAEDAASRRSCRSRRRPCTSCSATTAWLAGPLEFRESTRTTADARGPHRRLRELGRHAGRRASSRPARRCASRAPLFRKLDARDGGRGARAARPLAARDRHARAPRRARRRPGGRRRARARRRRDAHPHGRHDVDAAGARSSSPTRTTACSRSLGIHPHEAGARRRRRRRAARAARAPEGRRASARPASTTSATTRRTTASCSSSTRSSTLAAETGKPVVIHTRAADDDTLAALAGFDGHGRPALLLVAAPARRRARARLVRLVRRQRRRYPKAADLRLAARAGARRPHPRRDRRPYLAPQPVRGKPNEPAYVVHTLAALAEARGDDAGRARAQIDANARRVLRPARERLAEEGARPALPRRREHPRRDRPARRARARTTSCSRSARGSAC